MRKQPGHCNISKSSCSRCRHHLYHEKCPNAHTQRERERDVWMWMFRLKTVHETLEPAQPSSALSFAHSLSPFFLKFWMLEHFKTTTTTNSSFVCLCVGLLCIFVVVAVVVPATALRAPAPPHPFLLARNISQAISLFPVFNPTTVYQKNYYIKWKTLNIFFGSNKILSVSFGVHVVCVGK